MDDFLKRRKFKSNGTTVHAMDIFLEKTILARFILFSRIVLFKPKGMNLGRKEDS